jgi:hypothetical protein
MNNNSYKSVSNIGSNAYSPVNDPLTYCIGDNMDQRFLHGGNSYIYGQNSRPCQLFMSEYCAKNWDGFCEVASLNSSVVYPNNFHGCETDADNFGKKTGGEMLIRNTASRKYLVRMNHAKLKYEPFDPTVPTSPLISYWEGDEFYQSQPGIPEYAVNPDTIDSDIVMDKILMKPSIAENILINIYNTMKRQGTLPMLKNTKLGRFYATHPYFKAKGGV